MKGSVVLFALLCTVAVAKKLNLYCSIIAPSPTVPTSVHRLRPGDVKVIGAIGDSITAGRGATNCLSGVQFEFRGLSWSGGGNNDIKETTTLPNILREYNPNLYGFATGIGMGTSGLNVGRTGARSDETLALAKILTMRMKNDSNIDFTNDWKIITILMGGNDLCDFCKDETRFTAENYVKNLRQALDYLYDNVPRAFVNIVEILKIENVRDIGAIPQCQPSLQLICSCIAFPQGDQAQKIVQLRQAYQDGVRDLISSGRYDRKDDFTVVDQPFFRDTQLPRTTSGDVDFSFFGLDCFHWSRKGHETAAIALWNNMFEPLASKRTDWNPRGLQCPTEANPYLTTANNSQSVGTHLGK